MVDKVETSIEDDPEKALDDAVDAQDDEFEQEFLREQEAISKAVLDSAQALENLSSEQLSASLSTELVACAGKPKANALEIVQGTVDPGSRLDVLGKQLTNASPGGSTVVSKATVDLLSTLLGANLMEGLKLQAAGQGATTLLTHIIYAAKGQPLPELGTSDAGDAVKDIGGRLAKMSDKTFWNLFATTHDGTVADPETLNQQLAIMGMARELQPLKTQFDWDSADAKALQVDELVSAAMVDPDHVDLSSLYRRAGTLTLNGTPIPRAVMTELIRLAIADIATFNQWRPAQVRTPDAATIERLLGAEPEGSDAKAVDRNSARRAAKQLLEKLSPSRRTKVPAEVRRYEATLRASRGHSPELMDFYRTRLTNTLLALQDGKAVAANLDSVLTKSRFLDTLALWSDAYRSRESDPVKLKILLDPLSQSFQELSVDLNAMVKGPLKTDSAEAVAASFKDFVEICVREVALETAELLRTPPSASSDPIAGPAAAAEANTVRARTRNAAVNAINGEGGLLKFIDSLVPVRLRSESWATTLRIAADAWNKAETRDADQVSQAAQDFAKALKSAQSDLQKNWTPGLAFLGEGVVDALAFALGEKLTALGLADPQAKKALAEHLAELATYTLPDKPISDPAGYWQKTRNGVSGAPKDSADIANKLSRWQKASANPADPDTLVAATYALIDALIGSRESILGTSSLSDNDKAVLLRALDDLGANVSNTMSMLVVTRTV